MTSLVSTPLTIGGATVRNRLYRAPVLEGAGDGPEAAERYAEAFVPNAQAGVGLIIQGSSCIAQEGRTSPGMTVVDTREKVMRLAPMVEAVHAAGAGIFLQLGHGGIYAMEAWHEPYASQRRGPLLAASPLPWFLKPAFRGVPVHVMTTEEVRRMAATYGDIASWAREAGYDGIQLGSANAKLLDQFLSPFYNRRTDEFGGSLEARASVLRLIREAVSERAGSDYPCSVKVPSEVGGLPGLGVKTTVDEALRLCELVEEWGFDAVTPVEVSVFPDTTLSRGGVPDSLWTHKGMRTRFEKAAPSRVRRGVLKAGSWIGGKRAPFEPVWNRPLFAAAKRRVTIPVFGVGGIRTRAEVDDILSSGDADMVGIGRPFYVEPDLPARLLGGDPGPALCLNSNRCVPAQMLGMKGVCYNPEVTRLKQRRDRPTPG
ncbi:MAG TPA: NADH:flavin oxidoreductase [Acidimicrobiales bacterium]|jgi:2,4-dienoyl-CoA reductase-like NADH-dependent reductase (Old Yellow Enzyme family)|nr:NADH:flavin oxidoreductase [Acidimicrobiales bacterium]